MNVFSDAFDTLYIGAEKSSHHYTFALSVLCVSLNFRNFEPGKP